ncbi:hypothetical protein [Burkholderia multivorans]|uniref:hypothetical protein n=1 Tax=Burkholderia multivorans TaxID=87883 RepID=UPI0011B21D9F|nr:hypothetical protein [Burkholderia multivorans]
MGITFSRIATSQHIVTASAQVGQSVAKRKRTNGHQRAEPIAPETLAIDDARIRVKHWLFLLAISASAFYSKAAKGEIPAPCGYDGKSPYWKAAVVRKHLAK